LAADSIPRRLVRHLLIARLFQAGPDRIRD
jgi:hypothetical protein